MKKLGEKSENQQEKFEAREIDRMKRGIKGFKSWQCLMKEHKFVW
jgi:hypothetical protein